LKECHIPQGLDQELQNISFETFSPLTTNREIIPAINDQNGTINTDTCEKTNTLNSQCSSVFCGDPNTPETKVAIPLKPLLLKPKILEKISKNPEKQFSMTRFIFW
jgi:hypothetical protein